MKTTTDRLGDWWEAVEALYMSNEITTGQYQAQVRVLRVVVEKALKDAERKGGKQ